ncbi:Cerebroside-sulfatase [Occultella glacieicola]|uniref:Cerebroside-sulfatase n=1 Tax=Occultella glacieicola TaxID=2518684 RepID=A0ABY2E0S3_9MICO|nr:sulfatase [Occultella glacieicola]TDE91556.1 Cerebroside-sulfatase [Occultella glacieicola]
MDNGRPNIVLINCDDLGYGDLGCYGSERNRTPAIDRLAVEGLRLTDFYVASPVCSPSRAALMTGSLPARVGFTSFDGRAVLFPGMRHGLAPGEQTLATMLRDAGYATAMVGKWHCGDQPEHLPRRHGFDSYLGLPYSNDMGRQQIDGVATGNPPLPLILDDDVIEQQPLMEALTERYTAEAVRLIRQHRGRPFFLYLAHLHPHLPHLTAERFARDSRNGPYGAAVEYVDWSTDVILRELDDLALTENTIVIFTSDNGSRVNDEGGSNAPLRGTKRTNFEGGVRVPCLVRWPGRVPAGAASGAVTSAMDLLPTLASLAGGDLASDRVRDGHDISPVWFDPEHADSPHDVLPYYWMHTLEAVRAGRWKLHLYRHEPADGEVRELYDLIADPGETTDVASDHPEVVADLTARAVQIRQRCGDERTGDPGRDLRPVGTVPDPRPLTSYDPHHPYLVAMYDGAAG